MSTPNPHGGPPITFIRPGSRGPGPNVPANPVVTSPQAGPAPDHPGPVEPIDHMPLGMKPRIDYAPGTVSDPPQVDIGDYHDFGENPAPSVDTPSDLPTGNLSAPVQGIEPVINQGPSGIIPKLTLPPYNDATPTTELPATSPIAGDVPWHTPPKPFTTATTQVWDPVSGVRIGTQQPRRP